LLLCLWERCTRFLFPPDLLLRLNSHPRGEN
jgi:hypothetical protein